MIVDDAPEQVDAALLARVALDGGRRVDDAQFLRVGCHGEFVDWDDADDGEEGASRFPALGAAAGMVVQDVG